MRLLSIIVTTAALALLAAAPARASVGVEEEETVFRLSGFEAQRVYLTGDFNGWNPTVDLMASEGGIFEIRLYLLPGSYRYRFVADGVSMSDPDNPCRDVEGNSCFTLLDVGDGAFEVRLAENVRAAAPAGGRELDDAYSMAAFAMRRKAGISAEAALEGTIEGSVDFEGAAGLEAGVAEGEDAGGESFLLRGSAAYRFGENALRVFVRSDSILAGEEAILPLFGAAGAYRYPVELFLRGASMAARLPLHLDVQVVYASRIRGYASGLEAMTSPGDTASRRTLLDSDALAARLAARVAGADLAIQYRSDRRPREGFWTAHGEEGEPLLTGHDEVRMSGFRVAMPAPGGATIEGGAAFGRVDRIATGSIDAGGNPISSEPAGREWENGSRLALAVARDGDRLDARLSYERTALETETGEVPDCARDALAAAVSFSEGALRAEAAASFDLYEDGPVERFRFAGSNFWLDGDDVDCGLVPFFPESDMYEAGCAIEWRRELLDGLPWGPGLSFDLLQRGCARENGPLYREIRLSSGVALHPRALFVFDMRGAAYRYESARREFVDAFMGVHGRLTDRHWFLFGIGAAPWDFDSWRFRYTGFGRERYLEERGVYETYAAGGNPDAVLRLFDAEEALSEDWTVTLQAGFTF